MPAKRLSTAIPPFRVVSVVHVKGRRHAADYAQEFKTEEEARKRAEKVAQENNVISVYIQRLDSDGYPVETIMIKRPAAADTTNSE